MAAGALRCWCQVTPHTYHGSGSEVLVQGYRGEGMPTSPAVCEEGAARCCGLLAWLLSPWSTPASGGNASGLQRQDSPASALGQEMEIAAEEVLARTVVFSKWRWTALDVTLSLDLIASQSKEWPMTFINGSTGSHRLISARLHEGFAGGWSRNGGNDVPENCDR